MCIVIEDLHQFIGHCLIPLDPWSHSLFGICVCVFVCVSVSVHLLAMYKLNISSHYISRIFGHRNRLLTRLLQCSYKLKYIFICYFITNSQVFKHEVYFELQIVSCAILRFIRRWLTKILLIHFIKIATGGRNLIM